MNAPRIALLTLSFTAAALALAPLTDIAAQDTGTVGDKIRVTTDEEQVVGYWMSLDGNQLTLNTEDRESSLVLPLASLTKLEVSRGQKSKAGLGAIIGAPLGLVAGALIAYEASGGGGTYPLGEGLQRLQEGSEAMAAGALVGGLTGGLIGALIGSRTKADRWETVALDDLRVSLTPITPHGLGATVRVRWSP